MARRPTLTAAVVAATVILSSGAQILAGPGIASRPTSQPAMRPAAMELGTNFWNIGWHRPSDCFRNWKEVRGEDPWNPQFLKEIAIYRSLRFMDWDVTNGSARQAWAERNAKDSPKQNPVAYEWMIIAYEGGQHCTKNAAALNRRPEMHDLYAEYLREMGRFFTVFSHYCHVGNWGQGGAWGSMEFTGQPIDQAHKYRALVKWATGHLPGAAKD